MVNRHYTAGWMRAFAPKSGCCAAWAPLDPPRRASTPLIPAPDFLILPDGFLVIDLRSAGAGTGVGREHDSHARAVAHTI